MSESDMKVDVLGETCPVPLVETRKAIKRSSPGDVIEIVGDHPTSKKEIPMALEEMGIESPSVEEEGDNWKITIRIDEEPEI